MTQFDETIEVGDKRYQLVTLDFETFYDKEYTLSGRNINMSEYVRDCRFKAHGVSLKIGNAPTEWITGDDISTRLKNLDWSSIALIGQNVSFDGFILSHHFGLIPAFYIDTLSMARAAHGHNTRHDLDTLAKLHGRPGKVKRSALADTKGKYDLTQAESDALGAYAIDDADDTHYIFHKMYPHIPDSEMQLIDLTVRMFCDPVLRVDVKRVEQELANEIGKKTSSLLLSGATVDQLLSNQKFADLLRSVGINPPLKVSPTTNCSTYAFAKSDLAFQALANHSDIRVRQLVEARMRTKSTIGETRAVRFIEAGRDDMRLPVLLNYSGAHTHRWSGGNKMNMQNLGRDSELRRSILAPDDDHRLVVVDSAQIEARTTAWLAGQQDIVAAFGDKKDVYKLMASRIYGKPIEDITKDERFIGKICVLGLGYGMGHTKFQLTLEQGVFGPPVKISMADSKRIVNLYRSMNYRIVELWKSMDEVITNMAVGTFGRFGPITYGKGYITLPNGLFLQYPGLHGEFVERNDTLRLNEAHYITRNGTAKIYGGLLTENVVQALARCIVADQMLEVSKRYRIVMMTHDEIVAVAHKDEADECYKYMHTIMSTPPDWAPGLPLGADGGYDVNYSK